MKHAFIDRHANLNSSIHRLSPALKIKSTFLFLAVLLIGLPLLGYKNALVGFCVYGILALVTALISQVPFFFLLTRSALVLPFSALIVTVNYFSGNFTLAQMVATLFKSLLSIFTLLMLTSTTPFHEILKELSRWGFPKLFIIILAFMYRYFFLLVGEIEALERALQMRHSTVHGWQRIKVYANIVGLLLVRSYERAERVYHAMQMRGFTGDLS